MTAEPVEHTDPLLSHRGPWTEEDYLALGEIEGPKVELVDGELIVSPIADNSHQRLVFRLSLELHRQLTAPLQVLPGGNVRLGTGRIIIPDVLVVGEFIDTVMSPAAAVQLAVEIESDSGKARDRILKPALCAEAGIPWHLRIERKPRLQVVLYRLDNGEYVEHARVGRGKHLEFPDLDVTLEVDALIR